MSRPKNTIQTVVLNVALPAAEHARMTLHLYSDLEQRIPHGAFSRFLSDRLREYFNSERLDLAPYANVDAGGLLVSGTPEAIEQLREMLEQLPRSDDE